jgi:hypothetical protein
MPTFAYHCDDDGVVLQQPFSRFSFQESHTVMLLFLLFFRFLYTAQHDTIQHFNHRICDLLFKVSNSIEYSRTRCDELTDVGFKDILVRSSLACFIEDIFCNSLSSLQAII